MSHDILFFSIAGYRREWLGEFRPLFEGLSETELLSENKFSSSYIRFYTSEYIQLHITSRYIYVSRDVAVTLTTTSDDNLNVSPFISPVSVSIQIHPNSYHHHFVLLSHEDSLVVNKITTILSSTMVSTDECDGVISTFGNHITYTN